MKSLSPSVLNDNRSPMNCDIWKPGFKALLYNVIILATCNTILFLRVVKLANTRYSLHFTNIFFTCQTCGSRIKSHRVTLPLAKNYLSQWIRLFFWVNNYETSRTYKQRKREYYEWVCETESPFKIVYFLYTRSLVRFLSNQVPPCCQKISYQAIKSTLRLNVLFNVLKNQHVWVSTTEADLTTTRLTVNSVIKLEKEKMVKLESGLFINK